MLELELKLLSFDTICASGPNAALPHARPSDRTIRSGDLVILDFGAVIDGYHSDMTRTFAIGDVDQDLWDIIPGGNRRTEQRMRQGGTGSEGHPILMMPVGHISRTTTFLNTLFTGQDTGVGLEIHEGPWLNSQSDDILEKSQVVTVEPGVYRPVLVEFE